MSSRKDSYWKVIVVFFFVASSSYALDYMYVTHPAYKAKFTSVNTIYLLTSFNLSNMNGKIGYIDRPTFDARCKRECMLTSPAGLCKVAQTCWQRGVLKCELYQVNTCSQCRLASMSNETIVSGTRYDCHIWEFNLPTDPEPTKACAEYSQGTFKGDCSYCGRRGFDRADCSLASTCAAKYYTSKYDLLAPYIYGSVLNPCFSNGTAFNACCFGKFTRWWSLSVSECLWQDIKNNMTYGGFSADIPLQLTRLQRYSSKGNPFRLLVWAQNNYATYSGVSVGANWSLSIDSSQEGSLPSSLQLPIIDAPFLNPVNLSCGPMWLIERNVFFNATHIDSCAMNHTLFSTLNKWGGRSYRNLQVYIDVEIFTC